MPVVFNCKNVIICCSQDLRIQQKINRQHKQEDRGRNDGKDTLLSLSFSGALLTEGIGHLQTSSHLPQILQTALCPSALSSMIPPKEENGSLVASFNLELNAHKVH